MPWISFGRWSNAGGIFFKAKRLYIDGRWTPIVVLRKRYETWLGFFG